MIIGKKIKLGMVFAFVILLSVSCVLAYYSSGYQYVQTGPYGTAGAFSVFPREQCEAGQDFIIQIAPFGCTPAVVRSDLLEEQNVPVFCQLSATNMNPLIDVEAIDYISITGKYPLEVASVGFYPAQSALTYGGEIDSPIMNNVGYAVIILKQQKNESAIPEVIKGNLTANIRYDVRNAFGVGRATFYLPLLDDSEWGERYRQYSFWDGRGYLRAEGIDEDGATVSIYSGQYQRTLGGQTSQKQKYSTTDLEKGETSGELYLPGFDYCLATLNLRLDGIENPDTRARLNINGEIVEVAEGEKFLEENCEVRRITDEGFNKKVSVHCREDEKSSNFDLMIVPKVKLDMGNYGEKEVEVGDFLYQTTDGKSVYLGYAGTEQNSGEIDDLYVYFIAIPEEPKDKLADDEISSIADMVEQLRGKKITGVPVVSDFLNLGLKGFASFKQFVKWLTEGDSFLIPLKYSDGSGDIKGVGISIVDFGSATNAELSSDAQEFFDNAVDDYQTITESFSSEENPLEDTDTLGEKALHEMIILADEMGQRSTMLDLCGEFESAYPNSELDLSVCYDKLKISNSEIPSRDVSIDGEVKRISFENVYEPSYDEYLAEVKVKYPDGTTRFLDLRKEEIIYLDDSETEYIQLIDLERDSAVINTNLVPEGFWNTLKDPVSSDRKTLKLDIADSLDSDYVFMLTNVNLKKVAKVSVIPNIDYARTVADFNFQIEIEKREIKLAPEKAEEKIEQLDERIERWGAISENLGVVVKGMKTACLGTSAVLTVKNFLANTGGKGIARQAVMRGTGGWYEICSSAVSAGTYATQEQCLLEHSDDIENDVNLYYSVMSEQNDEIKKLQEKAKEKGLFSENVVNTSKLMTLYVPEVQKEIESLGDEYMGINMEKMNKSLSYESWNNNNYELEELRDIELYTSILSSEKTSPELKALAQKQLYSIFSGIEINSESYLGRATWASGLGVPSDKINSLEVSSNAKKLQYLGLTYGNIKSSVSGLGIEDETPVATLQTLPDGKEYIIILDDSAGNNLPVKEDADRNLLIYDSSGKNLVTDEFILAQLKNVYFKKYELESYKNEYKNPELRYYETGSYEGYPSIVPFDLKDGWYASLKETLSVFSNIRTYEASGKVMSFYLCNVGENRLEENVGGDDICEMITSETGGSITFPGLDERETSSLIRQAKNAVETAQRKYDKGITAITINGQKIKVGEPAVDVPEIQCEDFMSPKDCHVLFNVCDPVICPSSRCNFGGNYYVQDVVQSGIIGSIALCFPNIREKIYVPVCLTGISAGIDGWLSIQKSYRDCLQESLDTGETVGICDEIYSIYGCEFFWRQAIPLAKFGIPKLVEFILGQTSRGGGEYMGVANAWEGMENSVEYFTQYYAQNSYKAFKVRSTEEVGGELCNVFASLVYPETGGLLDTITTADSPPQFHGWFEEIPFTTATNPAYSQYKVYYHVYAGKDSGVYYRVYLKGDSGSSLYQDTSYNVLVATDYVEKGGYASETKDFTAPSGYDELCIRVNEQEECGFKEVSTSFAVDYVTEQYVADLAGETEIKTADECVSGTVSVYSLVNLNLQSAVENLVNPSIDDLGITRTCATENPSKNTNANASTRWVEVGYCGNKNMKCWLDTDSVKKVLKITNIEEQVVQTTTDNYLEFLKSEKGYLSEEEFNDAVEQIKEKSSEEKLSFIGGILDKAFLNSEKAYLLLLRGGAYGELALEEYAKIVAAKKKETAAAELEEENIRDKIVSMANKMDKSLYIDINSLDASEKKDIDKSKTTWTWNNIPVIRDYDGDGGCNCFDSVLHVYKNAGAEFGKFEYCLEDGIVDVDKDGCQKNKDITKENVEEGDILSVRWESKGKPTIHNIIFIEWTPSGKAKVLDWIGKAETSLSVEWKDKLEAFRVFEMTLKFDEKSEYGTVYAVGKPYVSVAPAVEEVEEEIGEDYISPIFEFKEGGVLTKNVNYIFYRGNWYWSFDSENEDSWTSVLKLSDSSGNVLDSESKIFVGSLIGKNYKQGLSLLTNRVIENSEGGIGNAKLRTSDKLIEFNSKGIFKVDQDVKDSSPIYFKNNSAKSTWFWSPYLWYDENKICWLYPSELIVPETCEVPMSLGRNPLEKNIQLIKSLGKKSFIDGSVILFGQSPSDSGIEIKEEKYSGKTWTIDSAIEEFEDKDSKILRKNSQGVLNTNDYSGFIIQLRESKIISEGQYVLLLEKTPQNDKQYYLHEVLLLKKKISSVCGNDLDLECALNLVNEQLKENTKQNLGEKYTDNLKNAVLTDEFYFSAGILDEKEWRDISGEGKAFSFEAAETLSYLRKLLLTKEVGENKETAEKTNSEEQTTESIQKTKENILESSFSSIEEKLDAAIDLTNIYYEKYGDVKLNSEEELEDFVDTLQNKGILTLEENWDLIGVPEVFRPFKSAKRLSDLKKLLIEKKESLESNV